MAFDGFVISNIISELNKQIIGGRIYKIYQPEADEITLVIKKERLTTRLHLSASASLFIERRKSKPYAGSKFLHAAS